MSINSLFSWPHVLSPTQGHHYNNFLLYLLHKKNFFSTKSFPSICKQAIHLPPLKYPKLEPHSPPTTTFLLTHPNTCKEFSHFLAPLLFFTFSPQSCQLVFHHFTELFSINSPKTYLLLKLMITYILIVLDLSIVFDMLITPLFLKYSFLWTGPRSTLP